MKRLIMLLCFFAMVSVLCACNGNQQVADLKITPEDENIMDITTEVYSEASLRIICAFEGDIHMYNRKYPIECIRNSFDGYRVAYRGSSHIALIWFGADGQKEHIRLVEVRNTAADFMELKIGEALKTVRELYPEGTYLFLGTGRDDAPRVSSHYTTDGYLISIYYDSDYLIEETIVELI